MFVYIFTLIALSCVFVEGRVSRGILSQTSAESNQRDDSLQSQISPEWQRYLLGQRNIDDQAGTERRRQLITADELAPVTTAVVSQVVSRPLLFQDSERRALTDQRTPTAQKKKQQKRPSVLPPGDQSHIYHIIATTMQSNLTRFNTADSVNAKYPDLKGYDRLQQGVIDSIQNLTNQMQITNNQSVVGVGKFDAMESVKSNESNVVHSTDSPITQIEVFDSSVMTDKTGEDTMDSINAETTASSTASMTNNADSSIPLAPVISNKPPRPTSTDVENAEIALVPQLAQNYFNVMKYDGQSLNNKKRPSFFLNNKPVFVTDVPESSGHLSGLFSLFDGAEITTDQTYVSPASSDIKSALETVLSSADDQEVEETRSENDQSQLSPTTEAEINSTANVLKSTSDSSTDSAKQSSAETAATLAVEKVATTTPAITTTTTTTRATTTTTRRPTTTTTATTTTTTTAVTTTTTRRPSFLEQMGQAVPLMAGAVVASSAALLPFYLAFGKRRRRRRRRSAEHTIWPIDLDAVLDKLFGTADYSKDYSTAPHEAKELYYKDPKRRKKYLLSKAKKSKPGFF